jgi:GTPase SAR1 family protein
MPNHRKDRLDALERRLTGPKRVALFGHRAVGKTTLLAMFYREAASGRVPGARLAAGDARTAEYLADKIAQIEAGEPPAGTLAETPLRLRLYRGMSRLELEVRDYQGEHVALGSEAPIREFFTGCDAVLLCLDGEAAEDATGRRRRQQEVEDLLERYIERSDDGTAGRPLAVLITKYDRVIERGGPGPDEVEHLFEARYGMTRHALAGHAPDAALFAVSAYGTDADATGRPPAELRPLGLDGPLGWLAERLEALDRDDLTWLFDLAPDDLARLGRCLRAFERRYPRSSAIADLRRRLGALRRRRFGRRLVGAAVAAGLLAAGVAGYDALGYHDAVRFERSGRPAPAVERRWEQLLAQHPTLPWFFPNDAAQARRKRAEWQVRAAEVRLAAGTAGPELSRTIRALKEEAPELAPQIARVERAEDQARQEQAWKALRVADLVAIDDPAAHLAAARRYLRDFPETPHKDDAVALVKELETLVADRRARDDRQAIDALNRAAALPGAAWPDLIEQAQRFLDARPESPYRGEAEDLLKQFAARADEADIEQARRFSAENPTRFAARREKYAEYLNAHRNGGRFVAEAGAALERIDQERDQYLYKQAYDHYASHPDDVPAVAGRLRAYLEANPQGRFADAAKTYVAWWESIATPRDYRVVLRRGRVEPNVGKPLSGAGPDLGVTLWVAGVEHGPSPVIKDSRAPIWDYTFPTPIRWKYGDPVAIRIVDHDWSPTGVFTLNSRPGDKLAMRLLSGTVKPSRGGKTELVFASDFREPTLPRPR